MATEKVELAEGKYTVCLDEDYTFYALRHGALWRDMTGDGMIFSMFQEIQKLKSKVAAAENCLVCAAIADPIEVIQNTLKILKSDGETE